MADDSLRENAPPDTEGDSLRVTLDLPTEVPVGTPVPITLRVENATDRTLTLYLTGRDIAFDLVVEDASGTVVWRRLHEQVVAAILRVEILEAGDALVLEDTWDQRSNDGEAVGPGTYLVRGEVLTETDPLASARIEVRVSGRP